MNTASDVVARSLADELDEIVLLLAPEHQRARTLLTQLAQRFRQQQTLKRQQSSFGDGTPR